MFAGSQHTTREQRHRTGSRYRLPLRCLLPITTGLILVYFLGYLGIFNGIDRHLYDLSFRLRGASPNDEQIIIVAIDDRSLARFGAWPLSRRLYADLLTRLKPARVVGFDLIMSESTADDGLLATAIRQHGRVVLPVALDGRLQPQLPAWELRGATLGHVHLEEDLDGCVRTAFHRLVLRQGEFPSFAAAIYETRYSLPSPLVESSALTNEQPEAEGLLQATPMWIDFYGPAGTFTTISMVDVLDQRVLAGYFQDKTVLVGLTATGLGTRIRTPFSQLRSGMTGVEVQANILANLAGRQCIQQVILPVEWCISILLSVAGLLFCATMSEKRALVVYLAGLLLIASAGYIMFAWKSVWFNPTTTVLSFSVSFFGVYACRIIEATRQLEQAYGQLLSHLSKQHNGTGLAGEFGLATLLTTGGINAKVSVLRNLSERMMAADRFKSMFVATLSHELRTPLNAIIGISGLLLKDRTHRLDDVQRKQISAILRSGNHVRSLISDAIDLSQIETGRLEVRVEQFDLYDLLSETADTVLGEAEQSSVTLQMNPVHLEMQTDRLRLHQCLLNILANAFKYTERGTVTVRARTLAEVPNTADTTGWVEIAVEDTGIGIPDEDMSRLFEPFCRLESPLRGKVTGSGLGLYLTRKLAREVLRGDISCSSTVGQGSRFVLTIPVTVRGRTLTAAAGPD